MCMCRWSVLFVYRYLMRPEEGIRCPLARVTDRGELPDLEMLLTNKPFIQHQQFLFLMSESLWTTNEYYYLSQLSIIISPPRLRKEDAGEKKENWIPMDNSLKAISCQEKEAGRTVSCRWSHTDTILLPVSLNAYTFNIHLICQQNWTWGWRDGIVEHSFL